VRVSDDALDALASHSWPGNVTDLADVMEKAVALSGGGFLTRARVEESIGLMVAERNDGLVKRRLARYHAEREELVALLAECGGNVAEMSRRMGVTRGAVAYRLKKHGLST
jgi:two-component system NtrC family response regulator